MKKKKKAAAFSYLGKNIDMKWTKAVQLTFIVIEIHIKCVGFFLSVLSPPFICCPVAH